MTRAAAHRILVAVGLAAAAACATTTVPSAPTAVATTTEAFSGTIDQFGSSAHPFAVAVDGSVEITLVSTAPLTTIALGIGVVTSDGTTCSTTITKNDNARSGTPALKGTAAAGTYCVRVYDSGNIPAQSSIDYTVRVVHP